MNAFSSDGKIQCQILRGECDSLHGNSTKGDTTITILSLIPNDPGPGPAPEPQLMPTLVAASRTRILLPAPARYPSTLAHVPLHDGDVALSVGLEADLDAQRSRQYWQSF